MIFELIDTGTGQVEAEQAMDLKEAESRNEQLRRLGEPQRWIRQREDIDA